MPSIYLSPSTQEFNKYVNGGTEEQYMNLIADYMIPYLDASGIAYTRNTPEMTAASSIVQSNKGNYDLHLSLHSNASAPANSGRARGPVVFYYPGSANSERAATIIANNLKMIYPDPSLVKTMPTTTLGEVTKTKAPAVLVEIAYHDNLQDAMWIKNNLRDIARNLSLSVADFLDVPFVPPSPPTVKTQ
ncbi:MAG: N-acetylmuramoyl-L-alanine amidase [Clostridia bacterium]